MKKLRFGAMKDVSEDVEYSDGDCWVLGETEFSYSVTDRDSLAEVKVSMSIVILADTRADTRGNNPLGEIFAGQVEGPRVWLRHWQFGPEANANYIGFSSTARPTDMGVVTRLIEQAANPVS